ncbi:MAG: tRNA (adenosine(37)-N6)-threonylcarbamoyltransferase complex ATPase subunit type 1 TsaE [Methylomonas sp.]|jgi:tRNA threonylcarbamoyladenosine biosynthesis protein TsaE
MLYRLTDFQETEALGAALWRALPPKALVFLYGELGAGKTTLLRGALRAAGYRQTVRSPTYSLVEEYTLDGRGLYHFDLYRLKDPQELEWLGIDDYLQQVALCFIEWPQMGQGVLPAADLEVHIDYQGEGRIVTINVLRESLKNKLQLVWKNNSILI